MAGVQKYFEGFAFRGRPPGSDQPASWHVEIGQYVDIDGVGRAMLGTATLTPEQAEVAGFPLSAILAGINAAALAEAEAARQERDALAAQLATALAAPPAGVSAVSDRQFFQALADAGTITQAEALAAVMTGTLPARIEAAVAGLPTAQQFAARMLLSGATTFERGHPMVAQLGAALGYDATALDALWRAAAAL